MKKFTTSISLILLFLGTSYSVIAQNTWSGASSSNWNDAGNWSAGLPDGATANLENIVFNTNAELSTTNDLSTTTRWRITFAAGTGARTITGTTTNNFTSFGGQMPQINNTSGTNQIIDFPIELSSDIEIVTSGALGVTTTFNKTISSTGGNYTIFVSGTGSVNFVGNILDGAGTINVVKTGTGNLTFTGAKSFTGTYTSDNGRTFFSGNMNASTLNMANSSNANFVKTFNSGDPTTRLSVNNLILSSGGIITFTNGCSVNILNSLSLGSGLTYAGTGFSTTTAANGFFYSPNATLNYTGPANVPVNNREWLVGNITVTPISRPTNIIVSGGTATLGFGATRYVPNNFTIEEDAVFILGNNLLEIGGNLSGLGFMRGGNSSDLSFNANSISTLRMQPPPTPAEATYNVLRNVFVRDNSQLTIGNTLYVGAPTSLTGNNRGQFQILGSGARVYANGNLIVQSTALGTGRITSITSAVTNPGPLVGDIVVERFIPLINTNLGSGRAWRFISSPVTGTRKLGQNLAGDNWPAGRVTAKDGNNVALPTQQPNNGTVVTGRFMNNPEAGTYGFDTWSSLSRNSNSSIRQFQLGVTGGNFSGATQPTVTSLATNPLNVTLNNADLGYMLYIRGDRTVTEPGTSGTKLFFKGENRTAVTGLTVTAPGKEIAEDFVFGNPFACDFDMQSFLGFNTGKVINDRYWFWDSKVGDFGAWRLVIRAGENVWFVDIDQDFPPAYTIHPGQAVLLLSSDEEDGQPKTLTYDENMKADEIPAFQILPFEEQERINNILPARFGVNYYKLREDGFKVQIGGVSVMLGEELKNELGDRYDVNQMAPFGSNRSISIRSHGKTLVLEGRENISAGDKIIYRLGGLDLGTHILKFKSAKLESLGLEAYLKDKFLNTEKRISLEDSTEVSFEVTSDLASADMNRFEVEFRPASTLPVNFTGITAEEALGDVNVKWNIAAEKGVKHYEVLHSTNGSDFAKEGTVVARNADGAANYNFTHAQPGAGNHFYRVRSLDYDGKALLSQIVKVTLGGNGEGVNVFPTVIDKSNVTIQFTNIARGRYTLQLSDASGRVMMTQAINHNGGSASQSINIPANMSKGNYNLRVSGEGVNYMQRLIKQ